ncbi:hypothetical protein [Methylobacterium sp. 77]|uniref:hypothetical protein n=1 Tax=Methylobacterium sp. 77 TaxID=1101192 RepID=UPI000363D9EF|nr:hypothetical protein [Methylobacterium sp. 77]
MIGNSASWPISARIFVCGFIGVVAAVFLVLGHWVVAGRAKSTGSLALDALQVFAATVIFVPLGFLVAGPFILIAIGCGVVCKRSIERHLMPWSLAAPVIVGSLVCVMKLGTWWRDDFALHHLLALLAAAMRASDTLLMVFGASVASVAFYVLSVKRRERPGIGTPA